jgi:hypothetical protein
VNRRAGLLLLVLAISLPGVLRAEEEMNLGKLLARVNEILEKADGRPAEATARDLAALDARIAPVLFYSLEEAYLHSGTERRREALVASFRFLPPASVGDWAKLAAGKDASLDTRLLLLRVLREAGGRFAVEPTLTVAEAIGPRYMKSPHVGHQVRGTIVAALAADSDSYGALERAWPRLPVGLRGTVLGAVERADARNAVGCLCRLLTAERSPPADVLGLLARVPGVGPGSLDLVATSRLRAALRDARPEVRRSAALVAGRVHDAVSVDDLLELLGDENALVRNAAVTSLRSMCGISLIASPARWRQWLEIEREWLGKEKDRELREVGGGKKRRVLLALHSLGRRRLHREQIVDYVAGALKHEDAEVRAAACRALGSLGSPTGVGALLAALGDADEGVRSEAHRALRAATGLASEPSQAAWRETLSASVFHSASPR